MRMKPDPARYEICVIQGEEGYYDKLDDVFISMNVLAETYKGLSGLPIYGPTPSLGDLNLYWLRARDRIKEALQSELEWKPELHQAETYLGQDVGTKSLFVVLYVDIVNSTTLSRVLSGIAYRTLVSIFLREVSLIIDGYGGFVHKYTGDGVIAFFPAEHNTVGVTNGAVDSAAVMRLLIQNILNPMLAQAKYPEVQFRIGVDSGETQIVALGAENVKSTIDLLGYTMNIAAKICAVCAPDQMLIGEAVYRSLHDSRKAQFKEAFIPRTKWAYLDATTHREYPLFMPVV